MSGRQTVDTRGAVFACMLFMYSCHWLNYYIQKKNKCPMKNLEALSYTISPRAKDQSVSLAVSIPFVVHSTIMLKQNARLFPHRFCMMFCV